MNRKGCLVAAVLAAILFGIAACIRPSTVARVSPRWKL